MKYTRILGIILISAAVLGGMLLGGWVLQPAGAEAAVDPASVIFPGSAAATLTGHEEMTITAVVPANPTAGDVVVQTPDGVSNPAPFAVGAPDTPDATGIGSSWAITASGTLTANTTWDQNLLVTGDVVVPAGLTLTVAPGVTIFFAAGTDDQAAGWWDERAEISVSGAIVAEGTAAAPIYFTSDAATPASEDWGGIVLLKDSTTSRFKYNLVQYATHGIYLHSWVDDGGHIAATVENCTLQYNLDGLRTRGRPEGGAGNPMMFSATIAHNLFQYNSSNGVALIASNGYGTHEEFSQVTDNLFLQNDVGLHIHGGSWWLGHVGVYPVVANNTFRDNLTRNLNIQASGSSDGSGSDTYVQPIVRNNLFYNEIVTNNVNIRLWLHPYGSDGVQVLSPTIQYNTIADAMIGISIEDSEPYDTIAFQMDHNLFYGFTEYAIANTTARVLTTTTNYWGTNEAEWDAGLPNGWLTGTITATNHLHADSLPLLTRIAPGAGQAGDEVTLYGANFGVFIVDLGFAQTTQTVVEESETAVLSLVLSEPYPYADVTVEYETVDGTAVAGTDYTYRIGTATIPAGSSSGTITIPIIDDLQEEPDKTFSVHLRNAGSALLTGPDTMTITIQSSDRNIFLPLVVGQ